MIKRRKGGKSHQQSVVCNQIKKVKRVEVGRSKGGGDIFMEKIVSPQSSVVGEEYVGEKLFNCLRFKVENSRVYCL